MELTTGNVDMYFANVTIEVDSAGHDIFQYVSNGITAGDQSVNGKQVREAIAFLEVVSLELQSKQDSFSETDENLTFYAKAIEKCSSYKIRWEIFLDEKEACLSLAANAHQPMDDQAAPATHDDLRETAPIHQPRKHNANAVATTQRRKRRRNQDFGMPKRDYVTKQTEQHDARLKEPTKHLIRGCRGKERFATPAPAGPSMIYLVTPRPILIPSRSPHLAHAQASMSKRKAPTPQTILGAGWGRGEQRARETR